VSEWKLRHSLTLAATTQPSRSQLRGIGPIANEAARITAARWKRPDVVVQARDGRRIESTEAEPWRPPAAPGR